MKELLNIEAKLEVWDIERNTKPAASSYMSYQRLNTSFDWARSFTLKLGPAVAGTSQETVEVATINLTNDDATPAGLVILEALCGTATVKNDVRSHLNATLTSNTVSMPVANSQLGGDPASGKSKTLFVRYQNAEGQFSQTVGDGGDPPHSELWCPAPAHAVLPVAVHQVHRGRAGGPAHLWRHRRSKPERGAQSAGVCLRSGSQRAQAPWGSGALPGSEVMEVGGVNRLTLSCRPSVNVSNLSYIVEVSDNLANWDSGSDHVEQISALGAVPVVMADKTPVNAAGVGRRFIRLRVVRE